MNESRKKIKPTGLNLREQVNLQRDNNVYREEGVGGVPLRPVALCQLGMQKLAGVTFFVSYSKRPFPIQS